MKYVVISGSHRKQAQSDKVSKWLKTQIESRGNKADLISLSGNPLPLWDETIWEPDSKLTRQIVPIWQLLENADGVVIVTPEWSGMVPAGLKNLLLYLSPKQVGHKPCLLVGVSASRGGAYPIAELRMSGYKNSKLCYIPDHLIVRNVQEVMNDNDPTSTDRTDGYIRKRALFCLDVLDVYTKAMNTIREEKVIWNEEYKHGM